MQAVNFYNQSKVWDINALTIVKELSIKRENDGDVFVGLKFSPNGIITLS